MSKACYTDFGKKLVCDIVWVLLGLVLTADFKFFLLFENNKKIIYVLEFFAHLRPGGCSLGIA